MNYKIKIIKDGGIYTITNLLNSLIPFLLLPAYTRTLEVESIGILSILENIIYFLVPLIMFGISGVLSVDYFRKNKIFSYLFSSAIIIPIFFSGILLIVIFLYSIFFKYTNFIEIKYLYALLCIGLMQVFTLLRLMLFQVKREPYKYLMLQGWIILSSVLLTLYFVFEREIGWNGRLNALFICYLISGIYSFISFIKDGYFEFNKIIFKKIVYVFYLGRPLVPHAIAMLVIVYFDRFLIAYYFGTEAVGQYAVAHQLGMGISLLQNSFTQVWGPFLFQRLKQKNNDNEIRRLAYTFVILLFIAVLVLVTTLYFSYEFIFGTKVRLDINVLIMVSTAFFFTGIYKLFVGFIFYSKENGRLSKIAFIITTINVLMNLLLIPRYGIQGAAFSMMISMMILAILTYRASQQAHPFKWTK